MTQAQPLDYPVFNEVLIEQDHDVVVLVQRGPHLTHSITLDKDAQQRVMDAIMVSLAGGS